jgi:hypothetical protein
LGTPLPRCDPASRLCLGAIWLAIAVTACAGSHAPDALEPNDDAPRLIAEPWSQADARFTSDPRWLGGDGALSIALDAARTLWLFGDSFAADGSLAPAERTGRAGSVMVRNSIAIQDGSELATARLRFYTRSDAHGRPSAFFPDEPGKPTWLWPAHGLRTPDRIIVFMHRMAQDDSPGGLGFKPAGPVVLALSNIEDAPPLWRIERLAMPALPSAGLVGASVLRDGAHVYAFGVRDPGDRALTLVRWSAVRFLSGDLAAPEVWAGTSEGFVRGDHAGALLGPVSTELSVTRDPRGAGRGFVLMHSQGFGIAPIEVRFAGQLTGPWSRPIAIDLAPYVEHQHGVGDTLVYAAKAHPEQRGAEWIVTFAINSLDATRVWTDLSIYYPRVLRVRRAPRRRANELRERRSLAWGRPRPARARATPVRLRTTCAMNA